MNIEASAPFKLTADMAAVMRCGGSHAFQVALVTMISEPMMLALLCSVHLTQSLSTRCSSKM
jgi:hypothetical protein